MKDFTIWDFIKELPKLWWNDISGKTKRNRELFISIYHKYPQQYTPMYIDKEGRYLTQKGDALELSTQEEFNEIINKHKDHYDMIKKEYEEESE